jgi:hypothetical protein
VREKAALGPVRDEVVHGDDIVRQLVRHAPLCRTDFCEEPECVRVACFGGLERDPRDPRVIVARNEWPFLRMEARGPRRAKRGRLAEALEHVE